MSENTPHATPETAPTEAAGDNATFVSDPVLSSSPAETEAHAAPAHAHAPAPTHAPAAAHAPAHAAHAAAPAPAVHAGISVDERAYEQYQALAKAVLACLTDKNRETIHATYDLVGPETFTLAELVKLSANAAGKDPVIIPVPNFVGKLQAFMMELAPGEPLMSRDNVDSMRIDNVRAGGKLFPLERYETLSVLAPEYIRARYNSSWLDEFRKSAHRRG